MSFIFAMSSREQFPTSFGMSSSLLPIGAHLVLYGVLATLLLLAFERDGRATRSTRLAAIAGAVLYGISDEFHQSFVPGRNAGIFDIVVNTVGAVIAVTIWDQVRSIVSTDASR